MFVVFGIPTAFFIVAYGFSLNHKTAVGSLFSCLCRLITSITFPFSYRDATYLFGMNMLCI